MDKPRVCVVMSTYNGEKYLEEQLQSVLNQRDVDVSIYIRDDGSKDGTPEILKAYSKKYDNIKISIEQNIGFKRSFLKALKESPDCDYYAFCDQDDIWFSEKLKTTICLLNNEDKLLAYCNAINADEKLLPHDSLYKKINVPVFPESLTTGDCHGFLFVFKKELRDYAVSVDYNIIDTSHDFWLISLASLLGGIAFDLDAKVALYRRLPKSVSNIRPWKMLINRVKRFFKESGVLCKYSIIIKEAFYGLLSEENRKFIDYCISYKTNLKSKLFLLKSKRIRAKYKIKILLNKY